MVIIPVGLRTMNSYAGEDQQHFNESDYSVSRILSEAKRYTNGQKLRMKCQLHDPAVFALGKVIPLYPLDMDM
jgi:hypothetical protein